MSTLILNDVSYQYKGAEKQTIRNLSAKFEPSTLYSIAGPSGSGKSTLLSLLAGLDLPKEGTIEFDGKSLSDIDLDLYRRRDIAMIFQAFHLFPLLTAIENVCFPMKINGVPSNEAKKTAKSLLEHVGITEEQSKRFPSKLSGGEQQRVAIARSLASGAKIIIADEPTGNLDVENTHKVMELLKNLAMNEGYCIIVVTHDMEVAKMADVKYRMSGGMLEEVLFYAHCGT
ncbi:MAG: ABC transporter ATP-binding protein [Lachnospiraceae bacterium]|nr:ABC transporter ATP-binding protein [Lachnospiraceae bacterium]